jgi:O-antigen/teichoic acid export membrane protein
LSFPNQSTLWRKLRDSRSAANFSWLAADKVLRMAAGFFVGLLIARHLGVERFGMLSYGFAIVAMIAPLSELGLESIVRRRLLQAPETAGSVLSASVYLRLGAGMTAYLMMAGCAVLTVGGADAALLAILGLGLFKAALFTPDGWMQANLKARAAVMAGWVAVVAGAAMKLWCVWTGAELWVFAWAFAGEVGIGGLCMWWIARGAGMPRLRSTNEWRVGKALLKESWPLLLSGAMVVFYMRMDIVMVKLLSGEREAGMYAAAVRLSEMGYFLPAALASSVLPSLLRSREQGAEVYQGAVQRYFDLSAALGYCIAVPIAVLGPWMASFFYGEEYAGAGTVLQWHALAAVFVFSGVARSQYLTNEGRQRFSLMTTLLGAVVNFGLNWLLIPGHGAMGAAWATVAAYGVAAWGATWLSRGTRECAWMQTRSLLLPFRLGEYLFRR